MATCYTNACTTANTTCYTATWITASPTITFELGFQGFLQGIDYVKEKIIAVFEDREKIKSYRKSIFTEKIRSSSQKIKKQLYTIMIPSKRNFRGQESQRK